MPRESGGNVHSRGKVRRVARKSPLRTTAKPKRGHGGTTDARTSPCALSPGPAQGSGRKSAFFYSCLFGRSLSGASGRGFSTLRPVESRSRYTAVLCPNRGRTAVKGPFPAKGLASSYKKREEQPAVCGRDLFPYAGCRLPWRQSDTCVTSRPRSRVVLVGT